MKKGIKVLKNKPIYEGKIYECQVEQCKNIWTKHIAKITQFDDENERKFILSLYEKQQEFKYKNIVEVLNLSESENNLIIAMRKYDCNLEEYIKTFNFQGNFKQRFLFALIFLDQILAGYEFFYKNQIAHRDIKPKNILIKLNDNIKPQFIITDFESAKPYQENVPLNPYQVTQCYAAPEIFENFIPQNFNEFIAQDIYSIGLTFQQFLYKKEPFKNPKEQKQYFIQKEQHKIIPLNEYDVFIEQMINIYPKRRITFENLKLEVKRIIQQIEKNEKELRDKRDKSFSPNTRQFGINLQTNQNQNNINTAREGRQFPMNFSPFKNNIAQNRVEAQKFQQKKSFSPISPADVNVQKNNNWNQLQNPQKLSPFKNLQSIYHFFLAPQVIPNQQGNQIQQQQRNLFTFGYQDTRSHQQSQHNRMTAKFQQIQCNRGLSPINW